jgi:hypothetical protein
MSLMFIGYLLGLIIEIKGQLKGRFVLIFSLGINLRLKMWGYISSP